MDRERVWMAHLLGDTVTVRHYAVLGHGEELTENPPTEVMALSEWRERHAEFGCTVEGFPLRPRPGVGMPVEPVED
jgi:hypothetical protein